METDRSDSIMHKLLYGKMKRFLIQSVESGRVLDGGNWVNFWYMKGGEGTAYQAEENSYSNVQRPVHYSVCSL